MEVPVVGWWVEPRTAPPPLPRGVTREGEREREERNNDTKMRGKFFIFHYMPHRGLYST